MVSHRTETRETAPSRAQRLARTGDVFFQTVRPYQRNNYLFEKPDNNYVFSTGYAQMRPKIDAEFLMCFLQTDSFVKVVLDNCTGTSYPAINSNDLSNLEIVLPASDDEQRRIGSFISNLDNLITLHQREFAFLCKEKSKKFRYIKNAWEQRKVREVTDRYDNLRIPVAASLRVAGTTPYYGANGIQDYVDGYTHDGEFILVAEDGANDLKNYPVKCVKGRIWVNNHAHVLQGKYDCADNQFLAYAISQADIESLLVGGGRAKLNAETLMGIDLLLPNKAEQIRIGKYLAQLDNLITLHQRKPNFYTGGYYAE